MYLDDYPNCYMGFTALITNPRAVNAREAAEQIPLRYPRMLLETGALHFVPHRLRNESRCSHPGMVGHVAREVAKIKGCILKTVVEQTRYNTRRVHDLPM